ncbi:glycosyltransferase family 4 protein [Candidatus Litorirhabdus singularis]|nr:glycosyltransferase family 4 protein [Candidatus Litorirhabdus singularis]
MRTKKVLFITHVGEPGGAEMVMMNFCNSAHHSTSVLTLENGSINETLDTRGIANKSINFLDGIKDFKREDGFKQILKLIPRVIKRVTLLNTELKKHDIIVCFSQKSFLLCSLAKPFNRKPIIWFMNDILSSDYFSPTLLHILKLLSKLSSDHVVLNSKASLEKWQEAGAKKKNISIIYPSIDIFDFEKKLEDTVKIDEFKSKYRGENTALIGIFGRLTPWKGQDLFIRAISRLKNVNAIVVGDALFGEAKYKQELNELVSELNLQDRIAFTGHIKEIPQLMSICDVICHCSTTPEPFGLVLAEATIAKRPVIASDGGGAKEIVIHGKTGQLTPIGNIEALVAAIEKYLDDTDYTKTIIKDAYTHSLQNFSKETMVKKLDSIIETL